MLCRAVRKPCRKLAPTILVTSASNPQRNIRETFMRSHLILVVGLLLSCYLPIKAQTLTKQSVLSETSSSLTMTLYPASRVRVSLVAQPIQLASKLFPRPAFLLAAAYKPEPSLESRLPIEEVRTSFLTESSFLVAHFWRGLQLTGFDSTLRFGSPRSGGGFQDFRPPSHDQEGVANSVGLDGISLRFSFGRDAETRTPNPIWHCMLWVIRNGRTCSL